MKKMYFYNPFGIEVQIVTVAHAILIGSPISTFPHKEESVRGNARHLSQQDIGKKFHVHFFDSYSFGIAKFVGFGLHVPIKNQFYDEKFFLNWCVFLGSKNTLIINPIHCDATPIM